ncbi:hypothetical protein KIN20_007531 [Parelaphostrongylus tenuis]|uniref:Transthyretin-like family protein n=1 Tax=Parelaphostrongylus tenuis TaxID=148309 RepID=A0AAD5M3J8_PARTN|nr:hypothetical protein KIN20_007531 [Parelaphostrongylus tenuis]
MSNVMLCILTASAMCSNALLSQSLGIRGVLRCGSTPLSNQSVRLYAKKSPLADAHMASNTTDSMGVFYLGGTASGILPLSPVLFVESDCRGKAVKMELRASKTYLTRTKDVKEFFDIGIVNLQ